MSDLFSSTLGVVGQAGTAFDKITGGRALRGAVAGKPRELMSVVPFSDSMGLTDAKDSTSGRDLTDAYGLTRKGDTSFGSHALGFLADNVLSPGNLAGGYGAFKAAPTLAKGVTAGAKALTGLDLLDSIGRGAKHFIGGEAGSLGTYAPEVDRLSKFASFDHANPAGYGVPSLVNAGTRTPPPSSSVSGMGSLLDAMPSHQASQAGNIIDAAKGYADARGAQGSMLGRFLGNESGSLKINDSLLKYLPWAGDKGVNDTMRNAAAFAGPQFPGGVDKLGEAITGHTDRWNHLANELLNHPQVGRLAGEVPEGSKFLGNGAEAIALRTPQGGVVRLSPNVSTFGSAGRADIPEILQPFRSIEIQAGRGRGGTHTNDLGQTFKPWIAEHLPMVTPVDPSKPDVARLSEIIHHLRAGGNPDLAGEANAIERAIGGASNGAEDLGEKMEDFIRSKYVNLDPWDFHGGNVAFTPEGNAIGHDGGMVRGQPPIKRFTPSTPRGDALSRAVKMGGPEAVRDAMAQGLAAGTTGQGMSDVPGVDLQSLMNRRLYLEDILNQYGRTPAGATSLPGVSLSGATARPIASSPDLMLGVPPSNGAIQGLNPSDNMFGDAAGGFSSAFKPVSSNPTSNLLARFLKDSQGT